jgi:rubrerythrin
MEYQQYICEICGEPYLGTSPPSRCPFCGAYEEKIVEAEKWKPIWGGEVSEVARKHLEAALQVIVKFLGAQRPDFKALETEKDKAKETIEENLAESHMRETRAINAYKVAFSEVEDEKVKLLFGELIKIESDHLKLSE